MEEKDKQQLKEILNYSIVNGQDVNKMQSFIRKYIDNSITICKHCPAQIRYAHTKIKIWANKNKHLINDDENEQ